MTRFCFGKAAPARSPTRPPIKYTVVGWPGGGAGRCRVGAADTNSDQGFSLIEALVALVVLAIATVGLIGAVEQHIDSTRAMERRATAMWVAENRLAELSLGRAATGGQDVAMLGQAWRVAVARRTTDDPEIVRVKIDVYADRDKAPTASLDGFVDAGQGDGA